MNSRVTTLLLAGNFAALLSASLPAQEVSFKRYTAEEGLESSHISALHQDRLGFLWVGTGSGLFRFDGYGFKAYKRNPADTTSISDNFVNVLFEEPGPEGKLWIGTTNGLNAFDYRTEKFSYYRNEQKPGDLALANFVQALAADQAGKLWVGTHRGAHLFDGTTQKFAPVAMPPRPGFLPEALDVSTFLLARDGAMWFGTFGQGLFKLDPATGACEQFRHDEKEKQGLGSNYILALVEDRSGTIWVGTHKGGLARVHANGTRIATVPVPALERERFSVIGAIAEDAEGVLWLGTAGAGLIAYQPRNGVYKIHRSRADNPHTLSNDWILALCLDRAGNLWVGTNGGLSKLLAPRRRIGHLQHIPEEPRSLVHNNVNAITADRAGNIWIGTEQGVSVFDAQSQWRANYRHDPKDANSLSQDFVQALHEDQNGDMWIGTFGGGLNRLDRARRRFTRFRSDTSKAGSLSQNFVSSIFEDRAGVLWIGTLRGLNKFDRKYQRFTRYVNDPHNPKSLRHNGITHLFEDRAQRFWIGTYGGGLQRMERARGEFVQYKNDRTNPNSLSDDIVYSIFEDAQGILWIGTNGGLNRFDPESERFTHYLEDDGLPNNVVFGILGEADAPNKLWLSTHSGLATFSDLLPAGQKFVTFEARKDGLQSNEFNQSAFYQSRSGELFFGGPNGVNRFYPRDLQSKSQPPNLVLTAFRKFNESVALDTALTARTELKLSHRDIFFTLEFAALDFTLPERNEYAYKLEGFNEQWIYCGAQNHATFTNLAPSTYIFRVKGANSEGVWNERGAALRLVITPPFWQTWWFRALVVLAILGAPAWFMQHRLNRLVEIERLRVRIASDLHDDIGATLTKISLHTELIQDGACSPEIVTSLRKIGAMSRELLTTMSDVVWSIDARNDAVGNLLDRMREFAASVLSAKSIALDFVTVGLDLQNKMSADVRQNVYLIFKEAINNVARHAEASRVDIRLENANGAFKMIIHDDGNEPPEAEKFTGHGLRNMKMRALRLGGELEVTRNDGCTVRLTAPALR